MTALRIQATRALTPANGTQYTVKLSDFSAVAMNHVVHPHVALREARRAVMATAMTEVEHRTAAADIIESTPGRS